MDNPSRSFSLMLEAMAKLQPEIEAALPKPVPRSVKIAFPIIVALMTVQITLRSVCSDP